MDLNMSSSSLLLLQHELEKPFMAEWAVAKALDERPLGDGSWLPVMAAVYFISLTLLKALAGSSWLQAPIKALVLLNNVAMCLYSAWVFVAVGAGTIGAWKATEYDAMAPFCDPNRRLLRNLDFQFYIFYLSKFWEWIDTFVLVLKGKDVWPPKNSQFTLHIFHHASTAAVGWLAWRQEMSVAWIGPLTNSFVHTLMYGYYAAVTIFPKLRKFGLLITPVQILQFIICLVSILPEVVDSLILGGVHCGATKRCITYMLFAYITYLAFFVRMFADKRAKSRTERKMKNT